MKKTFTLTNIPFIKIVSAFLLFISMVSFVNNSFAESTTVSQYYPAPFGVYNTIRLSPRPSLGGSCDTGTVYVDTTGKIQFCGNQSGVPTWGNLADYWTQTGNNLYPTDFANSSLKVGIGLNNPNEQLEITKNMKIPVTTATAGIIRMDVDTFIHAYGTDNTFVGKSAGNLTLTGTNNTAVGDHALFSLSSGTYNTAAGADALRATTTGSYNTAIGAESLMSNTTGQKNTAVGALALRSNTIGSENTALGYSSLKNNISGNKNSTFGAFTLFNNTTGNNNVAIGHSAGYANTTGSNNTFIGVNAGNVGTPNNLTNATAIGYNAQVTASNALILGGTGADAVKVGMGVITPISTLDVDGQIIIKGGSPGAGKVLTSNATGGATWKLPSYAP